MTIAAFFSIVGIAAMVYIVLGLASLMIFNAGRKSAK
jgi:hypothetical protein